MYPNLSEEKLTPDDTDYEAIYKERAAQITQSKNDAKQFTINQSDFASMIAAAKAGATLTQLWGTQPEPGIPAYSLHMFPNQRAAEPFEALRAKSDEYLSENGHRPRIFLANIGPLPNHKPRADFTVGFFEVGGF